jgi:MraZ protein
VSESVAGERWSFQRSVIKEGLEQMFFGQYEHNIDAKGRLTIPASFQSKPQKESTSLKGFDSNLIAYPKEHLSNCQEPHRAFHYGPGNTRFAQLIFSERCNAHLR